MPHRPAHSSARPKGPVKLAIVGGLRGGAHDKTLETFPGKVVLTAICARTQETVSAWQTKFPGIKGYTSYERLIQEDDCDAVLLATPMDIHAEQAVQAMRAGKHVLSEVVAATTLEDCWELVETAEKTGATYMLAENYCYMRPNMMILNMVRQGVFGELTYAEGAYIHDLRQYVFTEDGRPTWRTGWHWRDVNGNTYPTHSLGPVAQWLGINRHDRLTSTSTWMSKAAGPARYVERAFGKEHPGAERQFYAHGDSATTLIRTESGALIVLRVDASSPRPHNMSHYVLQGTTASYLSARRPKEDPLVWIEGRSPADSNGIPEEWENLWSYAGEFEHPEWKNWGHLARETGHDGGDFFVLKDFADAILGGVRPPIDVYDAAVWSSILPLSIESVKRGGEPVPVPDFKGGRGASR